MYRLFSAYPEREMLDGDGGQGALLRLVVIRIGGLVDGFLKGTV
jgi:hypothetical protein